MKKDESRFTIRFNPIDPRHKIAMEALEASGRRKASLIADAVCEYLGQHGKPSELFRLPFNSTPAMQSTYITAVADNNVPSKELVSNENIDNHGSDIAAYDESVRQTILDGLSAFKL